MNIATMLIVGILIGLMVSVLIGGIGLGIIVDMLVGLAGGFFGSCLFSSHLSFNSSTFANVLIIAAAGAISFLFLFRLYSHHYFRRMEA